MKKVRGKPRWQREQEERRNKRQGLVVRYWLLVISLLFIGGLVIKTFQVVRSSQWDGGKRINFVIEDGQVSLVSFDPRDETLTFLLIPQGTRIEVIHGYGKYRVEAILGLEELERRKGLLAESLQENLGIPVDGWVRTTDSGRQTRLPPAHRLPVGKAGQGGAGQATDNKEMLLSELQPQIFGQGETNLSRWDLVRLWWQMRKVRFDKVKFLDLSEMNVLLARSLPDQTQAWEIDSVRLDSYLSKLLSDSKIRQENLMIEVLNGTSRPGLAERGARIISNFGGEVVWVGNSEVQSPKCKVQSAKKNKKLFTINKIMKIWSCDWEEKKEEGRAEITLILGEDYWQRLNQK